MVYIMCLSVRVCLNDKCTLFHHKCKLLGFGHVKDLRMRLVPVFIQPIDQEISAFI